MNSTQDPNSNDSKSFDLVLVGVGGQGIVMLSNIIGQAAAQAGIPALTGELHGLSQRSGTIYIHMRIGGSDLSPLIPYGEADAIVSLEAMEALRYIEYLKDDGTIIMNNRLIHPPLEVATLSKEKKTDFIQLDVVVENIRSVTQNITLIDSLDLATQAGNTKTENSVFIGALSALADLPISIDDLKSSLEQTVPTKALEENIKAFELGKKAAYDGLCDLVSCRER
jgi:indolepyruvate ferredoxin oxidoreductase beta subunit